MKISLIALGNKMPGWVHTASEEYKKRLEAPYQLSLHEVPLIKRGKASDLQRIIDKEYSAVSALIPDQAYLIALDLEGSSFSSEGMASKLCELETRERHICFFIGGPEGHSQMLLKRCHERWSLSKLTLAHPLVRIVFLEALYRAWSINNQHPYHK